MKPFKLAVSLAVVLSALPFAALAEEEEASSPFTWSVDLVSDYVFRGASQTDESPALQAGLTWSADSGFYVGAWGSNVDFGSGGPDVELDTFIGYNTDLGDDFVNLDVMLNRYNYLGGDGSDLAYNELYTVLTFAGSFALTGTYSNDVWASGEDGWYFGAAKTFELPSDYAIEVNAGKSVFDSSVARDYLDWGVSVSKAWGNFSAKLGYVGTDSDGEANFGELGDDRVVLTLSYGM
ncbi:TorF family putative porin [Pseudoxanthomonas koreensis]|uniref:TorF family putative porin n=1 Tax=Pseudoxanthomonas koreensis TaxID=266061 RepID=UPI0013907120|nr:TorF family putative porin [Pseudoxanthomonas koreensis]KAF1691115.1 hypothetical protein CSC64_10225 [Pseudoxanthomonas koreensis]